MQIRAKLDPSIHSTFFSTALLCILLLSGCDRPTQSQPPPAVPEVATVKVETQSVVLTTELPGRTSAYLIAEIRPQVNGLIQKRLFTEGADVKAGELLYQIDPAPFKAALDNAAANLAVTQKNADRARAALAASIAGVGRQRATLELARTNRERFEEAYKEKAVSASQRDQTATEAEVADGCAAGRRGAGGERPEVHSRSGSGHPAGGGGLGDDPHQSGLHQDHRPHLGPGRQIQRHRGGDRDGLSAHGPGDDPADGPHLCGCAPIDRRAAAPEAQDDPGPPQPEREEPEQGRPDPGRRKPYPQEGTLQFRDVTVDPTTGSVTLRAVFPNPESVLLPNMFVRAVVKEGVQERGILVPQQAVSRDPKGNPLALVVGGEGKVEPRVLRLDRAIGDQWLVSAGLAPGDRVIVEGVQRARPGASVKEIPYDPKRQGASPAGPSRGEKGAK